MVHEQDMLRFQREVGIKPGMFRTWSHFTKFAFWTIGMAAVITGCIVMAVKGLVSAWS